MSTSVASDTTPVPRRGRGLRLLVGTDGSAAADAAAVFAAALARAEGGTVVLGHVYPAEGTHARGLGHEDAVRRHAEPLLARPLRHLGDVEAQTDVVVARSTAVGLQRLARAHDADLLVIGPPWRSCDEVGCTVERVVHSSPCPTAVVPASPWRAPDRVALMTGDAEAAAARAWAQRFAARTGTPLEELEAVPEDDPPGLLVVGAHPDRESGEVLLGDLARALVHAPPCPVVVVRAAHVPRDDA